jgi:HAE1 family hydrophobic/amphiphilic exporter-1
VLSPLVILISMPLALIGSCFALAINGQPLGLPALLRVPMVFGTVVSDAILLIDFVERTSPAQRLGSADRGRRHPPAADPETAVATIAALVPVAVGVSTAGGGA